MTRPAGRSDAAVVADLEARQPAPLLFLVPVLPGGLAEPPPFLPRGLLVSLDEGLGVTALRPFGGPPIDAAEVVAADLSTLAATDPGDGAERVLFLRNRFLLPRLVEAAPALLHGCRAVLVRGPEAGGGRLDAAALAEQLARFDLPAGPGGDGLLLFERQPAAMVGTTAPATTVGTVLDSVVRFEDGFVCGEVRLDRAPDRPCHVTLFAGEVPVGIAATSPGDTPDRLRFRLWAAPELLSAAVPTLSLALTRLADTVPVRRWAKPAERRFVPETLIAAGGPADALRQHLGVLLLADPADPRLLPLLRALAAEPSPAVVRLRLDGPATEATWRVASEAAALGLSEVVAHRGPVGRDKSAVQGLWHMTQAFARVVVLAVGDGPATVAMLSDTLDRLAADALGIAVSRDSWPAGSWAAPADRLAPLVRDLAWLFSLEEADYRRWTADAGGTEADRFAWTDALARAAARAGLHMAEPEPVR